MDFVADQLVHGTRFRALTVVDIFTKECLAIEVGQSLKGEHVVTALKRIAGERGLPRTIFVITALNSLAGRSISGHT